VLQAHQAFQVQAGFI